MSVCVCVCMSLQCSMQTSSGTQLVSGGERNAPPAYDQLFGISDLKEAKRESSNKATFVVKFCEIISGTGELSSVFTFPTPYFLSPHTHTQTRTVACAVCMAILSALPISMIVIGKLLNSTNQYFYHTLYRHTYIPHSTSHCIHTEYTFTNHRLHIP